MGSIVDNDDGAAAKESEAKDFLVGTCNRNGWVAVEAVQNVLQNAFRVNRIVRHTGDSDFGVSPKLVVTCFSSRDLKLGSSPLQHSSNEMAFVFERLTSLQAKLQLQNSYYNCHLLIDDNR